MKFTTVDRTDEYSVQLAKKIEQCCQNQGWEYNSSEPDIVIVVGGDGTFLRAIHMYIDRLDTTDFVGIHTGTLGFLTDYTKDELELFLENIYKNTPVIEQSPMLETDILYKNGIKKKLYSFNEIRISSSIRTLNLDVYIDNEYFERTTGSGICISTQTGSTAVNRSLNGAVIDSGLNVLQLCEILPVSNKHHHSLGNPYIMKSDRNIRVNSESFQNAHIYYDYLSELDLSEVKEIKVYTSTKKVRFARYRTYSYLKRLKNLY